MKQHKKFKIIMLVLSGLAILFVGVFCIVIVISNSPSHIAQDVLDGDSDDKLKDKYDKLTSEKKAEVLEIVTTEMQKKADEYKAGDVTGSFEKYVGTSWHSFEYIITNSSDVEDAKINEAENVIHNMELIAYGQELISEAENYIAEKDYIEAYKTVEIIEGTSEQAEAGDNEDDEDAADDADAADSIHKHLCNADSERVTAIKTAITNDAGTYYKDVCKKLAEENEYSEVEDIIEQISGVCTAEDIAVIKGYIFTREEAFDLYLANPKDYETLLANDEKNYADKVVNYYGYYDVDGDSFDELVFSNINRNEWDTESCYYVDFDEDKKCLEPAKSIEYSNVKSGIEWTALNDSVDWKNAYTDLLLERGEKFDVWYYYLYDIDENEIPELMIPYSINNHDYDYDSDDDSDYDPNFDYTEYYSNYPGTYSYVNGSLTRNEHVISFGASNYIYNNNFITLAGDPNTSLEKILEITTCKDGEFDNVARYMMSLYQKETDPELCIFKAAIDTGGGTSITISDMNEELKQYGVYITSQYNTYDYSIHFNTDNAIEVNLDSDYDASKSADIIKSIWDY